MLHRLLMLLIPFLIAGCAGSKEFTGFSYDPPDVTNTADKEITPQKKRIIGVGEPTVWVSNSFEGARVSDFYMAEDSVLEIFIEPENAPINNSPWYAFKIWSDSMRTAEVRLNYSDASHRYIPKVNVYRDGGWEIDKPAELIRDDSDSTATLRLSLSPDPVIVSAQALHTPAHLEEVLAKRNITGHNYVERSVAGKSKEGRPVYQYVITEAAESETAPVLILLSRQHPPEVSGYRASLYFMEEITADNELARRFRETFVTYAFPMINPDGAANGHWRHNAGGVDLNRDWENFNQPETRAVRDALLPLAGMENRKVFYGLDFHSTNENIFYPINEEVKTVPDNFTQEWSDRVIAAHPEVSFNVEEFDTSSPISKNWIYKSFGADAVTYEVDDELDAGTLETVSRSAARLMMEMLLEKWENYNLTRN